MTNQAEFFDSYADKWDSMERDDIKISLDRVVDEAKITPGMNILDVGTGTGIIIPSILEGMNDTGSIKAIDISQGMLRVAASKEFSDCVTFELVDIETYECPECSYDRVICNSVFPHFENKDMVLSRIRKMLKPGGMIVISHPIGREAVNRIHRDAGSVVVDDRVPSAGKMHLLLEAAGYSDIVVIDEPEFYLAKGRIGC